MNRISEWARVHSTNEANLSYSLATAQVKMRIMK